MEFDISDDYVVQLLLQEAEQAKERAKDYGVLGFLPVKPRTNTPNKRFFSNFVKNTVTNNEDNNVETDRHSEDNNRKYDRNEHRREKPNVKRRATKEQQELERRMKEEREKYNELRIAKKQQNLAESLLQYSETDSILNEDEKYREYLLRKEEENELNEKNISQEEVEIGPKRISDKTHQVLLKKKVRGRGSIGSNRLDQYFAGVASSDHESENESDNSEFQNQENGETKEKNNNNNSNFIISEKKRKKEKKQKKDKKEKKEKKEKKHKKSKS